MSFKQDLGPIGNTVAENSNPSKWSGLLKSAGGVSGITSMGLSMLGSGLNKDQNYMNQQSTKVNLAGRNMVGGALDKIAPGAGTVLNALGGVSDSMRDMECDEVTGECVESTKGLKSVGANLLDPVGRVMDLGRNLFKGNLKGALDSASMGLFNFDKSDDNKLKNILQQRQDRQLREAQLANRSNLALSESNRLATQANKSSNFGVFKKGGSIKSCGCTIDKDGIDLDRLKKLSDGGLIELNKIVGNSNLLKPYCDETKYKLKAIAKINNTNLSNFISKNHILKHELFN